MARTSFFLALWPDGSGFIQDPDNEDDALFMPRSHVAAGEPEEGAVVSYGVGPTPGIAYNVKVLVPPPGPLLQRRGHTEVFARSNPPQPQPP